MKKLPIILAWPFGTVMVYGALRNMIYSKVALPLWGYIGMTEGIWLDVSVSFAIVCFFLLGWKHKKKRYSARHIGILFSVITSLCLFYFDNTSTPFLYYNDVVPCWIAILCAYFVGIAAHYLYDWIVHIKKKDEQCNHAMVRLFQDKPVINKNEDCLLYDGLAKRIALSVITNSLDESFSIGITGTWGAGKTSMLHLVHHYLIERNDIIVIEFTPRQSATALDIQKDFLTQLSEFLSKDHSGAHKVTQKYIQSLGTLPDNMWAARAIGSISDVEISKRRENLKSVINEIGKKIVVLVDDFDRLAGDEIQEVLKLIDKNAAFPKTFFITAYDKKQTNQVISHYMGNEDEDNYTDKFFNLEISLPLRRKSNYVRVLREKLYVLINEGVLSCNRDDVDSALPKMYPFISKYLPTIRDVKRFVNLVSITLPSIEDNVLLGDFLLLSLIRYKYPEEYYNLGRCLYVSKDRYSSLRKKYYRLNITKNSKVNCLDILEVLFDGEDTAFRSLAHVNSFANYFYDLDSGHLLYEDLALLLEPRISPQEFRKKVESVIKTDSQKSDFAEFILSYENDIHNFDDTIKYLRLFLMARTYCDSHDLYIATLSYLLKNNIQANIKQFYIENEMAYVGLFKDVLNDRFEYWLSIESLHDALHTVTALDMGEVPELIFSYEELKSFALKKAEKVVSEIPLEKVTTDDVYRAMNACVCEYLPEPKGSGELIMQEAINMVKEAIVSFPDFFLKEFLSHRKDPQRSSSIQFYIEDRIPYTKLFKNVEDLSSLILLISGGCEDRDTMLLCISQFIDYSSAQKSWTPSLPIAGDISSIKQHDYKMYNQLFEGEPTYA